MLFFMAISAVHAYSYIYRESQPVGVNYYYYNNNNPLPVVSGPYPRYYLVSSYSGLNSYDNSPWLFDDFHNFDSFVGYRDLDVYYPDRGYVDVLRNGAASIDPPTIENPVAGSSPYGYDVYGMIPGGGIYVKHYYHDISGEVDPYSCGNYAGYGYDYANDYDYGCGGYSGLGYASFQPSVAYIKKPVFANSCQSLSICQYTHCSCN
jgi:hypothetical protein